MLQFLSVKPKWPAQDGRFFGVTLNLTSQHIIIVQLFILARSLQFK
jgi:hypothetical protein